VVTPIAVGTCSAWVAICWAWATADEVPDDDPEVEVALLLALEDELLLLELPHPAARTTATAAAAHRRSIPLSFMKPLQLDCARESAVSVGFVPRREVYSRG
jgi:hypothetical protein